MQPEFDSSGESHLVAAAAFTAAQFAAALGKTPQAVRKAIHEEPAGCRIVNGLEAATWTVSQLPEPMRLRLTDLAVKFCYRTVEAMLSTPPKRWQPEVPKEQIHQEDIDRAEKLRQALRPWLIQQHNLNLCTADLENHGVADYARVFGHRITGRYWRELFMRTLQRDGGAEDWGRLEIYLPNSVKRKESPARVVSEALAEQFGEIESFIQACKSPESNGDEQRGIWTMALGKVAAIVGSGIPQKRAARLVRTFLFARASFLAPSRDALLKAFNRKLNAIEKTGGDPKALRDGRKANGERLQFDERDRDLLIHRAVFYYRGDVAPAWRDLLRAGFSDALRQRYAGKSVRKSHVPASIMDSVSSEVAVLTVMHQGKRAFDQIKGHVDRSYDGIASRVCFVADDFTMPVYFYVPDGNGWFNLTRGQVLLFADFRSLRIVGYSVQPDRNYSSLTIRSLCTHVFLEHGMPKVLQFECGIWKSSTLIKGREQGALGFTEAVQGLREFGIQFIHSIRPRSKTVERIGGLLQDLMEHEPGYCGRDERRDAPETLRKQMAEVEARKTHPSGCFYSLDEWDRRLGEIIAQYNDAPQQGRILKNVSPDKAFSEFADADDPPMELSAAVRYLLAHHREQRTVTLNGVAFRFGKKSYKYRGAQIAHLVGKDVIAWFDPENPETLVVTNMDHKNPICVPRCEEPSALECLVDPESQTLAQEIKRVEDQASYMKTRFHALKSKYQMPQRPALITWDAMQLGQQIESGKAQLKQGREQAVSRSRATQERARKLGLPTGILNGRPESDEGTALMLAAKRSHERNQIDPVQEETL